MILTLSIALILALVSPTSLAERPVRLDSEQLKLMQTREKPLIVDIRRPDEWQATGLIPGSVGLTFFERNGAYDLAAFRQKLERLTSDPKQPVVLVCRSGNRSQKAAALLAGKSVRPIYDLIGGLRQWQRFSILSKQQMPWPTAN